MKRTLISNALVAALLGGASLVSSAAFGMPPLIYEGTLTSGGQAPDPWPTLRFSIVDAEGTPMWSTELGADGPIEHNDETGAFVAYLDFPVDAPYDTLDPEAGRRLQVHVCVAAANQGECDWLPLGDGQALGAVPTALALSRRVRVGPGMMYVGRIGSVPGVEEDGNGDAGVIEVELLPLEQRGRFVIEILGGHGNQAAYVAERHTLITGDYQQGRLIASRRERDCYDGDGVQEKCSSWGVSTRLHDDDGDGLVELRIGNSHQTAIYDVIVLIRGMGEVLDVHR